MTTEQRPPGRIRLTNRRCMSCIKRPKSNEMRADLGPVDVCLSCLREALALVDGEPEWADRPLPEDDEISAAFPPRSGRHDLYVEAMRLVGAKQSKGALVALVNWLLLRIAMREKGGERSAWQRTELTTANVEVLDEPSMERHDRYCVTLENGDCVSTDPRDMHAPKMELRCADPNCGAIVSCSLCGKPAVKVLDEPSAEKERE
jgi:hypothetical protein